MATIRILDVVDRPGLTADRIGKTDLLIRYIVDEQWAHDLVLPKEDVMPEGGSMNTSKVEQAIRAIETARQQLRNLRITV